MKTARFTQDQIIGIPKEHQAGATAADLYREEALTVRKRGGLARIVAL